MQAIKFLIVGATLIALAAVFSTNAVAARIVTNQSDVFNGITLDTSLTQDDEAYLRENLQWLRKRAPAWWQYIAETKPLTFVVDPTEGAYGHAAITECCDANDAGVITFGYHFRQLTTSDDPAERTVEAQRLIFLGVLVHEVTHVRDQHAGQFTTRDDYKTCVAGERSGLTKQLGFWKDVATMELGDDVATTEVYARFLAQRIKTETRALKGRALWLQYCGHLSENGQ